MRVVNSGQFCGIAEMASEVRFNQIYNYWWEDLKWSGVFEINWIYIKDVHHSDVKNIIFNGTPIANLKDGSEIDFNAGKHLLETFKSYEYVSDIFEAFAFMDEREKMLRIKRDSYYEIFRRLNEKGFIEDSKQGDKNAETKNNRTENKSIRMDNKAPRKNFRNSDVYYERKD